MFVSSWLKNIATQLSDYQEEDASQQFVHWSKDLLLSYYNDASCYIASLKPQDYIRPVVVRLLPGSTQNTCCAVVGNVTEHVTESGSYISRILNVKSLPTWKGTAVCATTGSYAPQQTYRSSEALNSFDIYPPVPSTGAYYVKILCSQAPNEVSVANLAVQMPPCKYNAAITEWVLYRALSGETDTALISASQLHYKAFTDLMGIQSKAEMAFQKALA